MTCDRCYQPLAVGEHGRWKCPLEPRRATFAVIDDQLEGGPRRFDTMGHDMPYIESKSQWKREVAKRGLIPYSPKDRATHDRFFRQMNERYRDEGRA